MFAAWLVSFGRIVAAAVLNTAEGVQPQQIGSATGSSATPAVVNPLAGGSLAGDTSYDNVGSTSTITFNADGTISGSYYFGQTFSDEWYDGTPDQTYEVKATVVAESGTGTKTGTYGSWLTFPQTWTASKLSGNGGKSVTINFQIRRQSDAAVVSNGSNNYVLSATNYKLPEGGQ